MTVDYRDGCSILQLIVYPLCVAMALLLCFRHGFGKASGWYFMITFSLLRITGAILHFIGTSHNPTTARRAITGELVCNSIGLSPLNLVCIGMLSRVNDFTLHKLPPHVFKGIGLLSLVGLILGINGGTRTSYHGGSVDINGMSKAAIIIFVVIYVIQLAILVILFLKKDEVQGGERRLLLAVAAASPFLLVRYIYSLRYDFTGDQSWSSVFGSVTKYLVMDVIMEIIVVLIALGTGLTLRRHLRTERRQEEVQMQQNATAEAKQGGAANGGVPVRTRPRRKPKGPISWLFLSIKYGIEDRRLKKNQQQYEQQQQPRTL